MPKQVYKTTTTSVIGETSRGVATGVFWDPHTPPRNNRPGVALITGSLGSGKTFCLSSFLAQNASLGKSIVAVDRKGDLLSLKNLESSIGPVRVWALGGSKQPPGRLDPFYMTRDPAEKLRLAFNVIDIFVGGLSQQEVRVLSPIIQDVISARDRVPSLGRVVDALRASDMKEASSVGAELKFISQMRNAKICFAPGNKRPDLVSMDGGITVATLKGITLPKDERDAKENREARLGAGIFYLLSDYIRRLMEEQEDGRPKLMAVDEAWSVLATKAGQDLVKEIALMGRSKNFSLILATQNYSHLKDADIDNAISTRFAFRAEEAESENVVNGIGLPKNEGFESLISDLDNGECVMRDWEGNFSTVQIGAWRPDWNAAFETNPYDS